MSQTDHCTGQEVEICGTVKVKGSSILMPDLDFEKETTMNMRYRGKQVYATLIDFGSLPNAGTKKVEHGILNPDWIHISDEYSYVLNSSNYTFVTVNCPDKDAAREAWQASVDRTHISMSTGINRSNFTAVFSILYTKADEVAE